MRSGFVVAVITALVTLTIAQDVSEEYVPSIYGMQSLSLKCDTEAKVKLVLAHESDPAFDFLRVPRDHDEPVEVLVTAERADAFREELRDNGVEFEVVTEDLSKVIRAELAQQRRARSRRAIKSDVPDLLSYPRYEEINAYIKLLAESHSDIVKAFSIGRSYEGREILGVRFTTGGDGLKPALLIDAGIHAREWIAPTTAIYAMQQLADNRTNFHVFSDIDIYIIPLLNPDGYEYTHLSESTRLWRKTRSESPYTICKGVDANRNFELKWMAVGASSIPCSGTYAGSRPFSEPETRALRDFILARRDRIKAYLSFHSFGNYILHPWGFTDKLPANEPVLRCAAETAEAELSKVRGTRYRIGSSTNVLYPAAGGSDDWTMGTAGIDLAYTVELPGGRYGFDPPPSEIIPVGQETFEAIKSFARYVNGEICQNL